MRRTSSRRPLSAWEPVVLAGGRPLPVVDGQGRPVVQDLHDVLVYRGRFRAFPGALIGMKPPQFSVWVFQLLGATRSDELEDVFPGSGAVTEAWRRYVAGVGETRPPAIADAVAAAGGTAMTSLPDKSSGLVDWPDGRDWHCTRCGAVHPEDTVLASCACGGTLARTNRAYYLSPDERIDVVVQYSGGAGG